MTAHPVGRLGDIITHGGTVISASTTCTANDLGIARQGDLHRCPIFGHGTTPFLTGSPTCSADGHPIVRALVDPCGCGAMVSTGSPTVKVE